MRAGTPLTTCGRSAATRCPPSPPLLPLSPLIARTAEEDVALDDSAGEDHGSDAEAAASASAASSAAAAAAAAPAGAGAAASHQFKGAYKPQGGDALLSRELLEIRAARLQQLGDLRAEAAVKLRETGPDGPASVAVRVAYLMKQIDLFTNATRAAPTPAEVAAAAASQGGAGAAAAASSSGGGGGAARGKRSAGAGNKHAMGASDEVAELADEEGGASAPGATAQRLTVQPPNLRHGTMRDYQLEGLNWMIALHDANMSGILADVSSCALCVRVAAVRGRGRSLVARVCSLCRSILARRTLPPLPLPLPRPLVQEMGLGKTLQAISVLAYLRCYRKLPGKHIVLAPKSTLGNWAKEFARWCPEIRVLRMQAADKAEREKLVREQLRPGKWDVVLTSYETAVIEASAFKRFSWYYVIIDEAHR